MKNRLNGITDSTGFKAAVLIVLTLIMLIPISMVRSLISERSYRAETVKQEISSSAGGILQFGGPVIRIPGTRKIEKVIVSNDGVRSIEYYNQEFIMWYAAEELDIRLELDTENKFKGIFYTPVFAGELILSGSFDPSVIGADLEENESLEPGKAELIVPFFNQKGIRRIAEASWNGTELEFLPGNRDLAFSPGGIYSGVNMGDNVSDFSLNILVRGAERVSILPVAGSAVVNMASDWPAPSFSGLCIPDSHSITETGFSAEWNCSSLSSGLPVKWDDSGIFDDYRISASLIETSLINVHDHYGQNERAVKYAVLFILMPFITLFMFEHFFKKRLHIIQYILAGTANIVFYLLLLSLSEHISFNLSYFASSCAVTVLICLYTFSILGKDRKAWFMAPVMVSVYTFLFMTLQSEDWALLIGSIGVFVITAFLMFVTRKIDFYQSRQNQK